MRTFARRLTSPGRSIVLLACGHALWGLVVYRRPLRELVRAGVADTVGDGIFRDDHVGDARAAGFWFLFAAPLIALCGYLVEAAIRADDRRALRVSGRSLLAIGAVGSAVMPRSGFPASLPIAYQLMRRGRRASEVDAWNHQSAATSAAEVTGPASATAQCNSAPRPGRL